MVLSVTSRVTGEPHVMNPPVTLVKVLSWAEHSPLDCGKPPVSRFSNVESALGRGALLRLGGAVPPVGAG